MIAPARFSVAVATILLLACAAVAQKRTRNNNWDISVWVTGATGEENSNSFTEAQTWGAGIFIGKVITNEIGGGWWRGRLEYGFDLMPVFVQSRPSKLYGGGFAPVILRWNSSHLIGRVTPYIELAGGAVRTSANLPSGDTSNFNFSAKGGGGIYLFTRDRQSFDIGCRWSHISNANLGARNPEFNGIEFRLGYHWFR
jgi:lipid A 3-O-deacylase